MSAWGMGVALAIIAAAVVYIAVEIDDPQQEPVLQRQQSRARLLQHSQVFAAYQQQHQGNWPSSWRELRRFSLSLPDSRLHIGVLGRAVPGGGIYEYRQPNNESDVIMASEMIHEAILTSAPAQPAIHFILDAQLQVRSLSEQQQRRLAPWLYEMDDNK